MAKARVEPDGWPDASLVDVIRVSKRDSAQHYLLDRNCISSSCAKVMVDINPGTLKGDQDNDQYLAVSSALGATPMTNPAGTLGPVQCQ